MLIYEKHHINAHVIPSRKLQTMSFQMAYNVAVCIVGTLNFSSIDLHIDLQGYYTCDSNLVTFEVMQF